jgi:hypothetical protein
MEEKIDAIYLEITKNDKMIDTLNIFAIWLGIYNSFLNRKQIDNNTIMKELNKQDKIYFAKIIEMLEEIKGGKQ